MPKIIKNDLSKKPQISVVIPVYNEVESISILHREILREMRELKYKYEIIIINDGSNDGTEQAIQKLCRKDRHTIGVSLRGRRGKATALYVGFSYVNHDIVITMDGDLQDDPKEIRRFVAEVSNPNVDLVNGWKKNRKDPLTKRLPSLLYNATTGMVTGVRLHDTNCGYKAYTKQLAQQLHLYGELHRYIPILASAHGYSIVEIPVHHRSRKYGKSKYRFLRIPYGFFDLITVVYITRFQTRPLHIFGSMGAGLFLFGSILSFYLMIVKFWLGENIGQRPMLLFAIFFMIIGIQIAIFGLLGEQIASKNTLDVPKIVKKFVHYNKV